jgi:hypothetical protein
MQKATLKITSILLCGLLIYNSLGYFLVLSVMRMAVRQQKWAQLSMIPEQQLSVFVYSKNTADSRLKILDKREIIVDGKLYDIVRRIEAGEQIKYFCVYDHEEESLLSKTRLFNSKAQQMPLQGTARNIINLIIKTGIVSENCALISECPVSFYSNFLQTSYSVPAIQISPPPPEKFI